MRLSHDSLSLIDVYLSAGLDSQQLHEVTRDVANASPSLAEAVDWISHAESLRPGSRRCDPAKLTSKGRVMVNDLALRLGTIVGPVIGELATAGLGHMQVVLPPAHDTASAVLAIPEPASDTLFISSGTWSLVGVVLEAPIINAEAAHANLSTNLHTNN